MKAVNYFLLLTIVSLLTLTSCEDDLTMDGDADGIISDQFDIDLVVNDLKGKITGDITLSKNQNWILTGALVVASGGKLTIEAGTVIKAAAGGTNVYIAVERGGLITAAGTAISPIKITSDAATPKAGDWGGLLIMGNAPISGGGSAVTEVVDFIYGGTNSSDNSGTLAYLILEYTGARINGEKEFNGLTLYGVGSGTSVSNIFIKDADDDAIEFFGGTVNVSNMLLVNATDDMFDWTQGYTGTATNIYGLREAGYNDVTADPRGLEGDGNLDGLTPSATPQSNVTINNLTIENRSTVANGMVDVIKVRRGSSATITNALFINGAGVPDPGDLVDCTDSAGDAAGGSISISVTGNNKTTIAADNKPGVNNVTITTDAVPTNSGCVASIFTWTGYTF